MTENSIASEVAEIASSSASNADPKEGAAMFAALAKHLYGERKDVPAMITAGEAGVKFCLEAAEGATDEILAKDLKTSAKTIAYNTAANCWPGWGDEGITIKPDDLKSGLKLACVSRALVSDLELGHKATGKAHWLIGALMLAARQFVDAIGEFQRAESAFQASGDASCVLMVRGYIAMARKFDAAPGPAADRTLAEALAALRQDGSKQAIFFADQIVTAERALFGRAPALGGPACVRWNLWDLTHRLGGQSRARWRFCVTPPRSNQSQPRYRVIAYPLICASARPGR